MEKILTGGEILLKVMWFRKDGSQDKYVFT